MTSKIVKNDFTKLNNFVRAISEKWVVRVGIFGSKASRKGGVLTNAELGAIHEFGSFSHHIPPRSFLRVPIFLKTAEILAFASAGVLEHLAYGKSREILVDLGHGCEVAIQQAFATAGFGNWAPNAPSTIKSKTVRGKKGTSPLIDTGQLRRAIASKVERRG